MRVIVIVCVRADTPTTPRLEHITSQHALTTQIIEIAEDGKSAHTTTYFTGIHFGKGKVRTTSPALL